MIKSMRIRLAGHMTGTGESRGAYMVWWRNWREQDKLEDLGLVEG